MRAQLVDIAAAQYGAFSWEQARREYSREEIRSRLRSGRWLRLFRGVYRAAACPSSLPQRLMAAQLALGRPVTACYQTAAALHGFGVVHSTAIQVAVPNECATHRRVGLRVHVPHLCEAEVVCCGAIRATAASRRAIDLARLCSRDDAIAVLDAALRVGAVTADDLYTELHHHAGSRGIVQARELVSLADGRAESPPESVLRLLCHDRGLPTPTPQLVIVDANGRVHRVDLGWEQQRLAAEYEGVETHSGAPALQRDYARHNRLVDIRWTVVYVTRNDLRGGRAALAAKLRRALGQT